MLKADDKAVVYTGAIKLLMEGNSPEFANLVFGSQGVRKNATTDQDLPDGEDDMGLAPVSIFEGLEISPVIFRAYDIRGVVGQNLSAGIIAAIGHAVGSDIRARVQPVVVVARDGRLSSPELVEALIQGLCVAGCDVIDVGIVPTPVLYFAAYHLGAGSGVMLTGSHNSPEYNGVKIMIDGQTLSGDAIQAIYKRITEGDVSKGQGKTKIVDVSTDYLAEIVAQIPAATGNPFKIVVDCGNGVAGQFAPRLYRAMGYDVEELFCEIDGNFPNHHPDPSQPENLQALIATVQEKNADLGFAFDGDGDRLGVVDSRGNIIWPDRQMMLFAKDVLSRNKAANIVFDVKCSRHLKSIIEMHGGNPVMCRTGHSLIKSKMREVAAPLAGEMSGHIFFQERWYGFDDALYAGARMLEILSNADKRPDDIFADLPNDIATPELRIPLKEESHGEVMQAIKENIAFADAELITIDGLRVDFPYGWGLVRPSNTGPFLVMRFEAEDEAAMKDIQAGFRQLLMRVAPDLKLPF